MEKSIFLSTEISLCYSDGPTAKRMRHILARGQKQSVARGAQAAYEYMHIYIYIFMSIYIYTCLDQLPCPVEVVIHDPRPVLDQSTASRGSPQTYYGTLCCTSTVHITPTGLRLHHLGLTTRVSFLLVVAPSYPIASVWMLIDL